MGKASKGAVSVQSVKGRLRLAWRVAGERYFLSLGLPDTPVNRNAAILKARVIEQDIVFGEFDPTLKKYQSRATPAAKGVTVLQLFDRFTRWKTGKVDERTLEKYRAVRRRLEEYFEQQIASTVKERDAEKFKDYLLTHQQPVTVHDRLSLMRGCWDWGIKQGLVAENPWTDVKIKVPPKQAVKPFALVEIGQILAAFRASRYYCHYADFVEFLFGTGCRTGEAIGLRWKHVSEDCSQVWIGEIVTRGKRKGTKTNKSRVVPLTARLQQMLQSRVRGKPDELVFPAPKGGSIDDNLFRKRAWRKILDKCGIEYRKPYISRATLVSHALDQGMPPVLVAELTGHSVQVIYKHYSGNIRHGAKLPELNLPFVSAESDSEAGD